MATMKAFVLVDAAPTLVISDIPIPDIPAGHVRVRLVAAALNRRDVWISEGKYASIVYPSVLGSDGAGVIDAVAEDVDPSMLNSNVVINPSLHWGDDPRVQSSRFEVLGMPSQGTFAEYIIVPAQACHSIPPHLSMAQAAALPLAGLTAYRAVVTQGNVVKGMKVLVTGAGGGVATWAAKFAHVLGAQVFMSSRNGETLRAVKQEGSATGIHVTGGWVKQCLKEHGTMDCIIDGIGGEFLGDAMKLCSPGATIVCYGATLGSVPSFELARVFWKQLRLIGSTMGSDAEFSAMIGCVAQHRLTPVIDSVCGLDEIAEAFARMKQAHHNGKIVVRIREE